MGKSQKAMTALMVVNQDEPMGFRIADTFTDSLARLTGDEQAAAKTTAFDLQMNPAGPAMQFHKLDRARDRNFWSVRVNLDIRIIVHRAPDSLLLCYVDHHDPAYRWAERRKLERPPKTGAMQIVENRERIVKSRCRGTSRPRGRHRRSRCCSPMCRRSACSPTACRWSGWRT